MITVPTILNEHHIPIEHYKIEDYCKIIKTPTNLHGLKYQYLAIDDMIYNDACDGSVPNKELHWYPSFGNAGYCKETNSRQEFSDDNKEILLHHLNSLLHQKDKIVIMEIGVCRNKYAQSSTSVVIDNKRENDIYVGIDIEDKSILDNKSKNIYTIKTPSENTDSVFDFLKQLNITQIDFFMIDGWHSINQVYKEWVYTKLLADYGIIAIHDTNSHPGPYFLVKSIDTNIYSVYKYLSDVVDWGISVAIKK